MASSVAAVSSSTSPKSNSDLPPPSKKRKTSNASCTSGASFGSETGRLLQSLPSVGSSLDDVGTGIAAATVLPVTAAAPSSSRELTETTAAVPALASKPSLETSSDAPLSETANASEKGSIAASTVGNSDIPASATNTNNSFKPRSSSMTTTSTKGSSKGSVARFLPDRRLQPKKRKMSYESYDASLCDSALGLASLASMDDSSGMIFPTAARTAEASNKSVASSDTAGRNHHHKLPEVSALEHLDALGAPVQLPAAPPVPAVTAVTSEPLIVAAPPPAPGTVLAHHQERSPQFGATTAMGRPPRRQHSEAESSTSEFGGLVAETAAALAVEGEDDGSNATFNSSGQRLLLEALVMSGGIGSSHSGGLHHHFPPGGRNRFESWGGMSDLSIPLGGDNSDTAAAIATASALHQTGLLEDLTAAAGLTGSCGNSVVSSVTEELYRGGGWHHAGTLSPGGRPPPAVRGRERSDTLGSLADLSLGGIDGAEFSGDLQKYVAAAVANVGDQLAELAGAAESAVAETEAFHVHLTIQDRRNRLESDASSSIATPLIIGAQLDDSASAKITVSGQNSADQQQAVADAAASVAKEVAATAVAISIDHDAVAAAVDAAQALDLSSISHLSVPTALRSDSKKAPKKRRLPLNKTDISTLATTANNEDPPKSTLTPQELEEIRERARKAAGYVPPSCSPQAPQPATPAKRSLPPIKKRLKRPSGEHGIPPPSVEASDIPTNTSHITPKVSNARRRVPDVVPSAVVPPIVTSSVQAIPAAGARDATSTGPAKEVKGQSSQKWDNMFGCLLQFIEERREEENKGASEDEKCEWIWDGNVPTTHKTKDGKALGRWINNQRSAKSKGTLKQEREDRLVNAGLKWSVLASNSWNEMLEELRIYIRDYTKGGRVWDGNVPTNYKIKTKAASRLSDEDKNLGRWVNRQRSLFQAGKLRKDRQLALEKVGLKWSMLATTSWESMYDTLVVYVDQKTKAGVSWDGNVPANFRTDDNPPRALGRWINRQRSAFVKKKLKAEYVDKLSNIGLKWSVHERKLADGVTRPNEICSSADLPAGLATGTAELSTAVPDQVGSAIAVIVAEQPGEAAIFDDVPSAQNAVNRLSCEDVETSEQSAVVSGLPTEDQSKTSGGTSTTAQM